MDEYDMKIELLLQKPLPEIPSEIANALGKKKITKTAFERKNDILTSSELQTEVGYTKMDDGTYLVSMVCPMPNITAEMIEWWFWWHTQDSLRYQVWYPGDHISIKYKKKDASFFEQPSVPQFVPNSQYPVERIGGMKMPLRIDFITPEEFGYSKKLMNADNIKQCEELYSQIDFLKKLKAMAEMYGMELDKVKTLIGDNEKESMKEDLKIRKAVAFIADNSKATAAKAKAPAKKAAASKTTAAKKTTTKKTTAKADGEKAPAKKTTTAKKPAATKKAAPKAKAESKDKE